MCIAVVMLVSIGYSAVYAESMDGSKEIVALFSQLEEKFLETAKKSEWVHVITQTEHGNGTKNEKEDWYRLVDGKIDVAYEWSSFEDDINVPQSGMLKGGVLYNFAFEQKWLASSTKLAFTTEFSKGIKSALLSDDKISVSEEIKDNHPVYAFSYQYDIEKQDVDAKIDDGLSSVRSILYVEGETGKPVESKLYFVYEDGSEILQRWTTFVIETGAKPPIEKLKAMETIVDKEGPGYEWADESGGQKISYYQTTYRSEGVVVSGQTITSYKAIYPYSATWSGAIYTGTPASILQDAGANWYSIQERCGTQILNWFISTTPVMVHGTSNWYKSSGTQYYYYDSCQQGHTIYVNGSHYARYNYVIMSPSPDFSIYYPAP